MNLAKHFFSALKGAFAWKYLKIAERIHKDDIVIFLIEQDKELNYYAFLHIDELLKRKYAKRVIYVSSYSNVLSEVPRLEFSYKTVHISDSKCENIKKYYQLVKFSDSVYFVTMTWPAANWSYRLYGKHGVNKEDIVCLCIYKLRTVTDRSRTLL